MTFSSLSDLYFIVLAAFAFDTLATAMVTTGVIYIPFIVIIAKDIGDTFSGKINKHLLMERIQPKVIGALIVFALFFTPLWTIDVDGFQPLIRSCENAQDIYLDDDVSRQDEYRFEPSSSQIQPLPFLDADLRLSGEQVRVSVMFTIVLRLSTGFNAVVVKNLPCGLNLTAMSEDLANMRITDDNLRQEISDFTRMCFNPAMNLAAREPNPANQPSFIRDPFSKEQGWHGHSELYPFYKNVVRGMYATRWIDGFQGSTNNQNVTMFRQEIEACERGNGSCRNETAGFPTCYEWWEGDLGSTHVTTRELSLRQRLVDELPRFIGGNRSGQMNRAFKAKFKNMDDREREDLQLRLSYFNTYQLNKIKGIEWRDYGEVDEGWGGAFLGGLGAAGNVVSAPVEFAKSSMIQASAGFIKGFAVLFLIALGPILLIVSSFNLKIAFSLVVSVFGIMLWPSGWELVTLMESSLFYMITPDGDALEDMMQTSNMVLIMRIVDIAFIGVPIVISSLMAMAGFTIGNAATGAVSNMSSGAGKGASAGVSMASKGAKNAVSAGKSMLKK